MEGRVESIRVVSLMTGLKIEGTVICMDMVIGTTVVVFLAVLLCLIQHTAVIMCRVVAYWHS